MFRNLSFAANAAGLIGALICAGAGLARVAGLYYVAGFEATTLFNAGVGLMVFACMIKLDTLLARSTSP